MTSEPSAVQRRHFLHTAATTLSWHSGSTTASNWQPFTFTQDGVEHAYGETVLFRTEGSAGNVLAVGLWRAEDGTTPIYTSEAGDETFLVLSGAVASSVLWLREASKAMRRVARSAAASSTDSWRFGRP